jgi:hypothetical protein
MVIATAIPSNLPVLIHCVRAARDCNDPVSYALDKTVHYVNKTGREIDEHLIKPGTRIHVYYDGTGETRVINRVVVDED